MRLGFELVGNQETNEVPHHKFLFSNSLNRILENQQQSVTKNELVYNAFKQEEMGSLMLELGQCGCQIGCKINENLSNSYYCTRNRHPNKQHTIMIDTQPKVLKPFLEKPPKWLDPANVKYFEHGRGNNWSYGYLQQLPEQPVENLSMAHIGPNLKQFSHKAPNKSLLSLYLRENKEICEYVLDSARKQLQTVDCAMCINVLCSLGGGTGSGLGTKIIELLSDEFRIDLHTHVILPNKSGETPLQVYNCALSLQSIQEHSTAIFTYENDHMIQMFAQQSGSLDHINKNIAENISGLIKINDLNKYDRFYNDIVSECIVGKQLNYLNLFNSRDKDWDHCFDELFLKLKIWNQTDSFVQESVRAKCISGSMLMTGKQESLYEQRYSKKVKSILNYVPEATLNCQQTLPNISSKTQKLSQWNEVSLVANSSNILRYLTYVVESGRKKYEAKAYLWHYQYANLGEAFQKIQGVIDQYSFFAHH